MEPNTTLSLLENSLVRELTRRVGPALDITLTNNARTMISVWRRNGAVKVRLAKIFSLAGKEIIDDLEDFIAGKRSTVSARIQKFIDNQPLYYKPRRKSKPRIRTAGDHYDLKEIVADLNRSYFGGSLKVQITWGRAGTPSRRRRRSIQYGSFDETANLIRIHPVLDSQFVSPEFIELVVFHEMLHKDQGVAGAVGERRAIHGREFKRREKEFEKYEVAIEWERKNVGKMIRAASRIAGS